RCLSRSDSNERAASAQGTTCLPDQIGNSVTHLSVLAIIHDLNIPNCASCNLSATRLFSKSDIARWLRATTTLAMAQMTDTARKANRALFPNDRADSRSILSQ